MIRRLQPGNSSVGVIIDSDEEDIQFCSTCMAAGNLVKLKERIWLDDKGKRLPDPPDADQFRQCWECGLIVPSREVQRQGTITGIQGVEVLTSPYDSKTVILGDDSTLRNRYKNLKRQKNKHPDPEIQRLIEQGYEVLSYQNYTPEPKPQQ